jgi:REP-associated tyrosine transposase
MNVMIQTRGGNVNKRVGDKSAEGLWYVLSAKGAQFNASLGQRPRIHGNQRNAPALKARFTSESFRFIIDAMPQSLSKVMVHIIFSTKDREPWLGSDVGPRMHAYLATVCRDLGADLVRVGGVADHVHIVTTLPRTVSQAQLIEEIKKSSSKWIKTLDARYRGFFWQRGYGAFSVSPSQLEAVLEYVDTQQEHHRTHTFQEEYRELLRRHGVDFDERYVWD